MVAADAKLFSLGGKETLATGLVMIGGSLCIPQAVILPEPFHQVIFDILVEYLTILARLLGLLGRLLLCCILFFTSTINITS